MKEIQDAGRVYIQRASNKPPRKRKRKPTHLVLRGNAESHREDSNEQERAQRTESPDQEKVWAPKVIRTITESTKFIDLNTWIKACRHLPT